MWDEMSDNITYQSATLASSVAMATASASNEIQLQHAIESHLGTTSKELGIVWVPFSINISLRGQNGRRPRFADAVHGSVIIEYKSPGSFHGTEGKVLEKARDQAEDYAKLLKAEEGRPVEEYFLIAWDGNHISFGQIVGDRGEWENLVAFDEFQAQRILKALKDNGRPLVHPNILSQLVGPESDAGTNLIPELYNALVDATKPDSPTTRTKLLFTEWNRIFGQVIGTRSVQIRKLIQRQGIAHHTDYHDNVPQYMLALSTHIALVAKLVAALSLPNPDTDVGDSTVDIKTRLEGLEDGSLFYNAGIVNILSGDFFAWYLDDIHWPDLKANLTRLVTDLQTLDFDIRRKDPSSVRDLFKGMYESFMPREFRHALGEYYTPDWLAEHALNEIGWEPQDQLLDPTCGTGTFLLEAIKRRLTYHQTSHEGTLDTRQLLDGIYGMDLNPLAVLAARASIVVFLSPYISPKNPITIPVWLADAINSSVKEGDYFEHIMLTEKGTKTFRVPSRMVEHLEFNLIFDSIRGLITADTDAAVIHKTIRKQFNLEYLSEEEGKTLNNTIDLLVELHKESWDGIWCPILGDRFTAGAIPKVSHIVGNPPWVKWSHLPPEYAEFIKEKCRRTGVFSEDTWSGGIESDISTVITFEAIRKWLRKDGKLAFFITGSVFSNESSQGFRRMQYSPAQHAGFQMIEDFKAVKPFEGVSNHPVLMIIKNGRTTQYPVKYRIWESHRNKGTTRHRFESWESFEKESTHSDLLAHPVYGTSDGPWLKGLETQHEEWRQMFNTENSPNYTARKGVCTDRNGIFFVKVGSSPIPDCCSVTNTPALGKILNIRQVRRAAVEAKHIFPLIRGQGVHAFVANPDPDYSILVPQRGMHGDPALPTKSPRAHKFLSRFKSTLEGRASYRRYQINQVFWSLWNVGAYTFAPYKVLWKEMSGNHFQAAYIGSKQHEILGTKEVIPDHKVYFVPLWDEDEAAYLTGILNAPSIAEAISSYSPRLSLGTNVVEHLAIPKYNPAKIDHFSLAGFSKHITYHGNGPTKADLEWVDQQVRKIFRDHRSEIF